MAGFGLKFVQWFIRGLQLLCCALILGIYSYFLATLHNHNFNISNKVRAVEGISGAGVLYTLLGLLFLCCLAGYKLTSFIGMVLDVCFIGAFIYVAIANKGGASSCNGYLDTPFGQGQSQDKVEASKGFTSLPSFHTACKLQTACLAVSIIVIFLFIISILMEFALAKNHSKDKRYGPGPQNDYTSGIGRRSNAGFFKRIFSRRSASDKSEEGNILPQHPQPDQLDNRTSYATEPTSMNQDHANPYSGIDGGYNKYETGYGYTGTTNTGGGAGGFAVPHQNAGYGQPATHGYEDGVYDRA